MQREIPGWTEEMERRGVLLLGRPLHLPQTAATVRVRDGETLVTDGPFAEAKEFIAGFDLVECADLDEAVEVAAKGPVSWFKTIEIRLFADGPWLSAGAAAFGRGEDGAASPYLLAVWTGRTPAAPPADQAVTREVKAWRQDLQARGLHILGAELGGPAGRRCSATGRSSRPGSSSPASTSSAALTASRPSSSPPRTPPPGPARSRYARSRTDDNPPPSAAFQDEPGRAVPAQPQTQAICTHEPHLRSHHLAGAYSGDLQLLEPRDFSVLDRSYGQFGRRFRV